MNQTKKMKKGITLVEIILAIVLIAIILGITIPKLMSNSQQAEIKQVITHDVQAIVESAVLWRKQNVAQNGAYTNLSPAALNSTLPSNMDVNTVTGRIYSTGFRTGENDAQGLDNRGAFYTVRWQFGTTNNTGRFAIGIDINRGVTELGWDPKIQQYAIQSFQNAVASVSQASVGHNAAVAVQAAVAGVSGISEALACDNNVSACFDQVNVR